MVVVVVVVVAVAVVKDRWVVPTPKTDSADVLMKTGSPRRRSRKKTTIQLTEPAAGAGKK